MKKLLVALFFLIAAVGHIQAQQFYSPACTTLASDKYAQGVDTTPGRQVANPYLIWDNGSTLSVKFLGNASPALRSMVMKYAKEWEQFANVKLNFVSDNTPVTNMRIKLGEGLGHNSLVGINCNDVPQAEQTMNLDTIAFLDYNYYVAEMKKRNVPVNMDELRKMLRQGAIKWDLREMRGTVLHEFGHALGLLHEQSYPGAIKWKKDTVYAYYKKTQKWDKDKVDFNVLLASNQFFTNGTSYDPKSIMHYSVEPWQTTDGYALPANYDLSVGDKALIKAFYPKDKASSTIAVPRVTINNFTNFEVINDSVKGGLRIYPSFDLKTNDKLGTVHVLAMLVDENGYYIKDDNNFYNWGGYVAAYPKLTLLPNSNVSYNKGGKKNLELFLPYNEIPGGSSRKVTFRFSVVLQDVENNQWVYVMNYFTKTLFNIKK